MQVSVRGHGIGDDHDDPIVWECGSALGPDGRFSYMFLTRNARDRLLAAFGQAWLDSYLAEAEREVANYGVQ